MALEFTFVEGGVCAPLGFRAAGVRCGIRKADAPDLALVASDVVATSAGVFTRNQVRAWCAIAGPKRVGERRTRAIVCNAGNANACNGSQGRWADLRLIRETQSALRIGGGRNVVTASTGVIGRPFPIERACRGIREAAVALERSADASARAARAIMTTDLIPKECAVEVRSSSGSYRIGGIAKGSGMIAPNMGTMLAFLTTDARLAYEPLAAMLRAVAEDTFNRVTVDGDTSTNDMAVVLANGLSGVDARTEGEFGEALSLVCAHLARLIARDGEGATKLVTVRVLNAERDPEAAAKAIAESPLVKTALFGNDPNWGRILAAAGRSATPIEPSRTTIRIAGHTVFERGQPTAADLGAVSKAMAAEEVEIVLDLGFRMGRQATVWTCDMSYDYVKINAEYTT